MIDEKKFYEETNHMIDARDIYRYIKMMINPYGKPFEGTIFEFGNKLMDYIIRMEKQPKVGEWTPCSDKLPEEGKNVLCMEEGTQSIYVGWMINVEELGSCWFDDAGFSMQVVAWMPLPEPYRGDEK